jgi:hypothetical protein
MAHDYKGYTVNNNQHLRECAIHGQSYHDNRSGKCIRCSPRGDKGIGVDAKAVARRHAIEDHQARLAAEKNDWFSE